jgi:hypothetical protein
MILQGRVPLTVAAMPEDRTHYTKELADYIDSHGVSFRCDRYIG